MRPAAASEMAAPSIHLPSEGFNRSAPKYDCAASACKPSRCSALPRNAHASASSTSVPSNRRNKSSADWGRLSATSRRASSRASAAMERWLRADSAAASASRNVAIASVRAPLAHNVLATASVSSVATCRMGVLVMVVVPGAAGATDATGARLLVAVAGAGAGAGGASATSMESCIDIFKRSLCVLGGAVGTDASDLASSGAGAIFSSAAPIGVAVASAATAGTVSAAGVDEDSGKSAGAGTGAAAGGGVGGSVGVIFVAI